MLKVLKGSLVTCLRVFEEIEAWGHRNITARNKATFEIAKESWLTTRGDCIVGVRASKGAIDLSDDFKRVARIEGAKLSVLMEVDGFREVALGCGGPSLSFEHPTDLVARKSGYVCGRTLMIGSDKAACDFSRNFVRIIQDPKKRIRITLTAEV
ncbi:MAG: DUF371 domain-containing protein [Candidatus Bathyarchaeota archaeon]|nr:DUF371 domain-containing protein [Candidatus Bathyarchaeota archaeon]